MFAPLPISIELVVNSVLSLISSVIICHMWCLDNGDYVASPSEYNKWRTLLMILGTVVWVAFLRNQFVFVRRLLKAVLI